MLLFSNPREDFFRVPLYIQRAHALSGSLTPIPPESLEGYPSNLMERIPWVFELITTLRFLGWHTPNSSPTTFKSLLRHAKPMSRIQFLKITLLRVVAMGLFVDFLVWNIRVNDTGFFIPQLLLNRNTTTHTQVPFTPDFPALPAHPSPPVLTKSFPYITLPHAYPIPAHQIPYPLYFPLPRPTPTSPPLYASYLHPFALTLTRFLLQTSAIYAGISGMFALWSLFMILASYLPYPPYTPNLDAHLAASRWFNPAAYPHPFAFDHSISAPPSITSYWTITWHSLFRRAFLRPWVALGVPRLLSGIGVFLLSGILHFWGIRTQLDPGHGGGGWGCLVFFLAQIPGIILEQLVRRVLWQDVLKPLIPSRGVQRGVEFAVGWGWVMAWFLWVSPWFWADFTWGALWRVEAAPVSLWQGGWARWAVHTGVEAGEKWWWWEWGGDVGGRWWEVVL